MNAVSIYVDKRQARASAWGLTIILSFIILGPIVLLIFDKIEWDGGPVIYSLFGVLFSWIYGSLIGWTVKLFRLSRFFGPIIKLRPDGIQDNWSTPFRSLNWNDIKFTEWRYSGFVRVFRVSMKQTSLLAKVKSLFGLNEIEFPEQYLLVSAEEIAKFMLENAPNDILR